MKNLDPGMMAIRELVDHVARGHGWSCEDQTGLLDSDTFENRYVQLGVSKSVRCEEGRLRIKRLVRTKGPTGLRFGRSCEITYEYIDLTDPKSFDKIKKIFASI